MPRASITISSMKYWTLHGSRMSVPSKPLIPGRPEVPFRNARHFVFTFHDSTLEAIAVDVSWSDALDPRRTSSDAGVSVVVNGVVEEKSGT